jgi:hypothetical protein
MWDELAPKFVKVMLRDCQRLRSRKRAEAAGLSDEAIMEAFRTTRTTRPCGELVLRVSHHLSDAWGL